MCTKVSLVYALSHLSSQYQSELYILLIDGYKNIIGTNGTEGTEGTEGTTSTEGTGTESTKKCTSLCVAVPNVPCTLGFERRFKKMNYFSDVLDDLATLKNNNDNFTDELIPHLLVLIVQELRVLNSNLKNFEE